MSNPLVTVIMQNYNTSKDILDVAINSVINQTFKDFAFIFIDDWSTDYDVSSFFAEIETKWKNERPDMPVHLIKKPQNGPLDERDHNHGHSFCRNWGLDLVKTTKISDYVFFMDSDDEIMPNCLEILWSKIEKDPEVEISIGNFVRDEVRWCQLKDIYYDTLDGNIINYGQNSKTYTNLEALDVLCDPYMIPVHRPTKPSVAFCATWNKIFKVSLFDTKDNKVRFPDYHTKDDNYTAHRLLWNAKKIGFIFEITYFYRPGGNLADANLYKTMDIVNAHRDRVQFFELIFDDTIKVRGSLRKDNFEDFTLKNEIIRNEHMIYLFTLMAVYKNIPNDKDKVECYEEFSYCLNLWRRELVYGEQKFLEMCVNWYDKIFAERLSV